MALAPDEGDWKPVESIPSPLLIHGIDSLPDPPAVGAGPPGVPSPAEPEPEEAPKPTAWVPAPPPAARRGAQGYDQALHNVLSQASQVLGDGSSDPAVGLAAAEAYRGRLLYGTEKVQRWTEAHTEADRKLRLQPRQPPGRGGGSGRSARGRLQQGTLQPGLSVRGQLQPEGSSVTARPVVSVAPKMPLTFRELVLAERAAAESRAHREDLRRLNFASSAGHRRLMSARWEAQLKQKLKRMAYVRPHN